MSDKVDNRAAESLSAMMDGEAAELETLRTIKALSQDSTLRDKWHRYHLASMAMRRDSAITTADISNRVAAALASDASPGGFKQPWYKPFSKIAVAASVAAMAVIGVQQLQLSGTGGAGVSGDSVVAGALVDDTMVGNSAVDGPRFQLPSGFEMPHVSARTVSTGSTPTQRLLLDRDHRSLNDLVDRDTHQQIQAYLSQLMLRHAEQASVKSRQSVLPIARLPQVQDEQ